MSPVKIHSCLVQGLEGQLVEVEADIQRGMSAFRIVGLGDQSVQESKERIRSAIRSTSAQYPVQKKIINLAPASLKKQGPVFDLPIAISLLLASGQLPAGAASLDDTLFIGELALNGEVRPVPNILSIALFAREQGFKKIIVPADNQAEATLVEGLAVIAPQHLQQLLDYLSGNCSLTPGGSATPHPPKTPSPPLYPHAAPTGSLFQSIQGQPEAKKALMLAAAGGHHLLLHGSPGIGKTMLARSLPELLPPLSDKEFFQTLRVYSAANLSTEALFRRERPFRQAHQTSSLLSLTGGGNPITPGEISLAHHGVLFLDEFPEFPRAVIEALRQPLEDHRIHIARQGAQISFPAKFTLVAAMNPCPCGFLGDRLRTCTCAAYQIQQYRQKLSGPIMDRIDLTVSLERPKISLRQVRTGSPTSTHPGGVSTPPPPQDPLTPHLPQVAAATTSAEELEKLKLQVQIARERQERRYKNTELHSNSDLSSGHLRHYLHLDIKAEEYLTILEERASLSARGYTQLLRTALTIADLKNNDLISNIELAEAFQFKNTLG